MIRCNYCGQLGVEPDRDCRPELAAKARRLDELRAVLGAAVARLDSLQAAGRLPADLLPVARSLSAALVAKGGAT